MKNITIIANADSFWTQRFIENVSLPLEHAVTLITAPNTKYSDYYCNNGITVVETKSKFTYFGHKINALLTSINTLRAINKSKPDLLHVHYAYMYILKVLKYAFQVPNTIITYWGSDLLRTSTPELQSVKEVVSNASCIVVMTKELKEKLLQVYGDSVRNKVSIIDMGISAFKNIDQRRNNPIECRQRVIGDEFKDKIVITIGYNAGKAQQHDKVLESLNGLPAYIKKKIMIVLPLTYQRDDTQYLNSLQNLLNNMQVNSVCISDFMNNDQIADLCISTDIFINAQTTDALSSSMIEQFYANSTVLNGEWLNYSYLKELGVKYYTFHDFDSLAEIVCKLVKENSFKSDCSCNLNIIKKSFSWEVSRKKWEDVYSKF